VKNKRWQEVERLYHSILERDANERAAFLVEACAGDEALKREVESLLAYEGHATDFIETPALEIAARMITNEHSTSIAAGDRFNQYRIISQLGAGGMGEVYLAEDTSLRRNVALKFLPAVLTKHNAHLRRFEIEARAVAALSHPNVCIIHEVIKTENGRHCIVMEYIEGMTLRERMAQGDISIHEALDITIQIASALASAHAAKIVHRDIKPENVMLRGDGYVKVLDFGLAKLADTRPDQVNSEAETRAIDVKTLPGVLMGTVAYMSPEQARGLQIDKRTDIWSLGVVLHEIVTGCQPFAGPTPTDVIIAIAQRDPEPLAKSRPEARLLQPVIEKTLAKDQNDRYQSAEEALDDLRNIRHELELASDLTKSTINPFRGLRRNRFVPLIGTAILVAIILALALWFTRRASAPTVTPIREIHSLAVLPMENFSGDPAQDYFAQGMTETLIAGLSKVVSLRVTSRTSVMQFKGSQKPLRQIAQELNVDAIIEGSVQRFGDRIHVGVRLLEAKSEGILWSEEYDRELRDVLTLQNEVAQAVTQAIKLKLTPEEQSRLAQTRRINPAAYDDFLRGRYYLSRQTKADNDTAIQALKRAVDTDPDFAVGWAELAQAYVWRLFLFAPDEKDLQERAFVAVTKAINLDPDLPEAYLARGRLLWTPSNHFPHEEAIREYRRALALNPSLDEARNQLALVLGHVGLLDEALAELDQAMKANPSNNLARFRVGETLLFKGQHEEALTALRNVPPDANPAMVGHQLVLTLFDLGRREEAEATLERFLKDYPEDNRGLFTSLQAMFAATKGQNRVAEEKIKLAIERGKGFGHFHHTAYHIACAYALMNRQDEAITWLESAADGGFPCYTLFATDHNLDNLRQNERFQQFMSKMKQKREDYKKAMLPAN